MSKPLWGWFLSAMALLLFAQSAVAQDDQRPLGDLAREQRDARKLQNVPDKIYTNEDVKPEPEAKSSDDGGATVALAAGDDSASSAQDAAAKADAAAEKDKKEDAAKKDPAESAEPAKPQPPAHDATPPAKPATQNAHAARPITDRPKDNTSDFLIVPVGTEIKVDISEENPSEMDHPVQAKVVVPVRVGFATAIPALSKATVQLSARYYDAGYGTSLQLSHTTAAQVTDITVDGTTYDVESNEIDVGPNPGLRSEVTFTLLKALAIQR